MNTIPKYFLQLQDYNLVMKFIVCCTIINFYCNLHYVSSNSCFEVICIASDYNKLTKPPPKNEITDMQVEFRRIQVLNINENESTITLKLAILMVHEYLFLLMQQKKIKKR